MSSFQLPYVYRHCKNFSFLVKVDDDVFLQLDKLERMLRAIRKTSPHRSVIIGNAASGWKPVRNNASKYFITEAQDQEEMYPTFVTGPSYVVSKAGKLFLIFRLVDEKTIFSFHRPRPLLVSEMVLDGIKRDAQLAK